MSDSLRPHEPQHARPPCPSPALGVHPNTCPLSWWCHPNISSCCHLLLLPSIFPSIRGFSSELALRIRWPKYWSFSISPSSEYSEMTDLISLQSKGLSRVFSSTTVQKYRFFSAYPSLWFYSLIRSWLLEKPKFWLYRPLLAKWCLYFLIHCLGMSRFSFQEICSL